VAILEIEEGKCPEADAGFSRIRVLAFSCAGDIDGGQLYWLSGKALVMNNKKHYL
jgi:hypothetical protein